MTDSDAGGGTARRNSVLSLIGIVAAALVAAYITFLTYVPPNAYGIMIRKLGMNRGVQQKVYQTGLHLVVPFFEELHLLPKSVRVLEMTNYPKRVQGRENRQIEKAAHIQTSDGFYVDVDVSIIYRIDDPYTVFTKIGPGNLYLDNGILPKAEPILKQALGELTTEEFYNSPLRYEKMLVAQKLLNEELKPKGLHIDQVLIRYFTYSTEIQRNIEEKKLKDQLVFKNQAEARASKEAANLERIIREGKKNVDVKLAEGEAYAQIVEGKIQEYVRTKHSDADLLIKLAEARKTELKTQALRKAGSAQLVGLKMADVLKGLDMIILPSDGKDGINPLDLRENLKLFEVRP